MSHTDLGYVGRDLKILKRFAKAAGLDLDNLSPRDEELLIRLVMLSRPFGFEVQMKPGYICEKLTQAREVGKRVRIVPDREFWKNGPCQYQLDGWSYHLELYTPRTSKKNNN